MKRLSSILRKQTRDDPAQKASASLRSAGSDDSFGFNQGVNSTDEPAFSLVEQVSNPSYIATHGFSGNAAATNSDRLHQAGGSGGRWLIGSFALLVMLPTFIALFYNAFVATRAYVVETKMTVNSADKNEDVAGAASIIGKLGLGKATSTTQDSLIVLDYIKSRSIINDIGGREFLEKLYSNTKIDWWSRLEPKQNYENVRSYWGNHVSASVDTISNIITVHAIAFSPQDALLLSEGIVKQSEALLNRLSLRNRTDVLNRASDEVERSGAALAKTRSDIIAFQQRTHSISPLETGQRIATIISSLTAQRIEIETQLATSNAVGIKSGPGLKPLEQQLAVINDQIKRLDKLLTNVNGGDSVSDQIREFEILSLRSEFNEKIYTISRSAYEQARRDIDRQQLYLTVIVPPILPDYAAYPRVFIDSSLIFVAALVLWAIGALLSASVFDSLN